LTPVDDRLSTHFVALVQGIVSGGVAWFLGAGASAYARPRSAPWTPQSSFPPLAGELAAHLARRFEYPVEEGDAQPDVFRVAAYTSIVAGRGVLYHHLRRLLDRDLELTGVHRLIAELPARLRDRDHPMPHQLVITTNWDDCMERAFREAGEPVDVVWYVADGPNRGKFIHRIYQGEVRTIDDNFRYRDLDLDRRSLVIKPHGSVDRFDARRDSYVVTLDDYIEYLTRADVSVLLPLNLVEKLYESAFLFLGYGMRDANLLVMLHRIARERRLGTRSWAVQWPVNTVDRLLWRERDVDVIQAELGDYIQELEARLNAQGASA